MTDLPAGWSAAPLADLIDKDGIFVDGDWVESKDQDPGGEVRLVQLADVGEGHFRDRSNRRLTRAKADVLRCTELRAGDILVARMPEPLGRACIYPGGPTSAVTVVDVCIVRVNRVDSQWLMWALNSPEVRRQISSYQSGTTRKRISRTNLARVEVRVPPLAEQRRIVAALESRLSAVAACETDIRRAALRGEMLWRSAVDSALGGSHSTRREPWPQVYVGDHAAVQGGIQKQPKRQPVRNRAPFLRVANVLRAGLDLSDVREIELFEGELPRYSLQAGDLLVVEGNGSPEQLGRAAVWRNEIPNCVHQNHLIRLRPHESLDPDYLELVWNSPAVGNQLRRVASSTSGLFTLSTKKVKGVRIPLPSREIQRAVVEEVSQLRGHLDVGMENARAAAARAQQLARSLLAEAFAGRLVPQDPNDEPASELLARIRAERQAALPRQKARSPRTRKALPAPPTRVTGDDYQQETLPL